MKIPAQHSSEASFEMDKRDRYNPKPYMKIKHPEWSRNATIYEVNIRQFTPEGTFSAFAGHLPRLRAMGIDILWLMPIHPIGKLNRKGSLGSYYSVRDYFAINPEFGTLDDFRSLVDTIHDLGMHIIIDWVANHSAWDNPLTLEHPEWYTRSREGNFQSTPWYDWDDIIDFDYKHPGIREYMTGALKYWVKETGIDGYRCDVAGFIPLDFWENAREELDSIKPVFMLAEWESRDLHRQAFDASYAWSLYDRMKDATTGGKGISGIIEYIAQHESSFPEDAYRVTFTDNHDKNSWEGNQFSNFGEGLEAAIVLAATVPGMPLVYSGQEAGLDRSLAFFEKDIISWQEHQHTSIYTRLFALKHSNRALWNGAFGGNMVRIHNDRTDRLISFGREKDGSAVLTIINFCSDNLEVTLDTKHYRGEYTELFTGSTIHLSGNDILTIGPWGYKVLVMQ